MTVPAGPAHGAVETAARIAALEAEIGRHQVVQQQLVLAKGLLDSELQRFSVIQHYVQKAVLSEDLDAFYQLTIESVVEAFEFEVALITRVEDRLAGHCIVAAFGFEDDFCGRTLTLEEGWLDANESRIFEAGHPLLDAWRDLGFKEVILCPFRGKDGEISGVVAGGRTNKMGDYFAALSDALRSSFQVMVAQAGALLVNQEFATQARRHNEQLRALSKSFSRFVPFEFLELLGRESIQKVLPADSVSLEMTVLFVDLREFTTLSESLGPEMTFGLLNEYLGVMQPPISASGGFINHYQGDGIMALFHRAADTALVAAAGMFKALERLNKIRGERGDIALRIGMGINTGELMLGAIGGAERLDSNVIGDSANLASRTEGLTKLYGSPCLLTDHSVKRLDKPAEFALRELDRVLVRGRVEPVAVYELLDVEPAERRAQKIASAENFAQGLSLYRTGEFAVAIGVFAQCVTTCPDDVAAKLYIQRCAELVQHAPGPDWKGVTILDGA